MTYPYRVPVPPSFWERHPLLVPLLLVFATLINWGCGGTPDKPRPRDPNVIYDEPWLGGGRVVRVGDSVTGRICYVYEGYKKGGIWCEGDTK